MSSFSKWWNWHLDTISRCQDDPYSPRIHHQRSGKRGSLVGEDDHLGQRLLYKRIFFVWSNLGWIHTRLKWIHSSLVWFHANCRVVPNDDTCIWTLSSDRRMPPILQGSPPEMEHRGSLGWENDHFRQRLFFKSCTIRRYWHLDTISRLKDAPYLLRIKGLKFIFCLESLEWIHTSLELIYSNMVWFHATCQVVPDDDTSSPDIRMPPILQESTTRDGG